MKNDGMIGICTYNFLAGQGGDDTECPERGSLCVFQLFNAQAGSRRNYPETLLREDGPVSWAVQTAPVAFPEQTGIPTVGVGCFYQDDSSRLQQLCGFF